MALGTHSTFSDTVTGTTQTAVTWSVIGGGTISSGGTYTAPSTMPSSNHVTIVATLKQNTAITGTFALVLNTPVPSIGSPTPTDAIAGATTAMTLSGAGFQPGVVVLVNNAAAPTTYNSPTSVTVQVSAAPGAQSVMLLPQNPAPCIGTPVAYSLLVSSISLAVTNKDGSTNNGTDGLSIPITLSSSLVHVANNPSRVWQLSGAGSLVPQGSVAGSAIYTGPATMPANRNVTVTASVSGNSAVTTSYSVYTRQPNSYPKQLQWGNGDCRRDGANHTHRIQLPADLHSLGEWGFHALDLSVVD